MGHVTSYQLASPGLCITTAIWRRSKLIANGSAALIRNLCCHWLKGLRQRQITVVIQVKGQIWQPWYWICRISMSLSSTRTDSRSHLYRDCFPGMYSIIIDIRWSQNHCIFIHVMWIPVLVRQHLCIEIALRFTYKDDHDEGSSQVGTASHPHAHEPVVFSCHNIT